METINFLKNEEGKYLNFKNVSEPYFTSSFINATPIPNINEATKLSSYFKCDVYSIDVESFKNEYISIVSKIVILGELLHRELSIYNDNIPVLPKLNKHVRQSVQGTISKLKQFHKLSDDIINNGQDELFLEASADFDELITNISRSLKEKPVQELVKMF